MLVLSMDVFLTLSPMLSLQFLPELSAFFYM